MSLLCNFFHLYSLTKKSPTNFPLLLMLGYHLDTHYRSLVSGVIGAVAKATGTTKCLRKGSG